MGISAAIIVTVAVVCAGPNDIPRPGGFSEDVPNRVEQGRLPGLPVPAVDDSAVDGSIGGISMGGCPTCSHRRHGCLSECWWCHSTCDLFQHQAYFSPWDRYYYFRPYNFRHVPQHQAWAASVGLDPRNPYSNRVFESIYDEVDPIRNGSGAAESKRPDRVATRPTPLRPAARVVRR